MRPHLATELAKEAPTHPQGPSRVLILGPVGVARLIAEELEESGFQTELQAGSGVVLPAPSEVDGISRMRAILKAFANQRGDHVHPGITEWADRPELVSLGQELGLKVIAPPARVLSALSNRLNLLIESARLGIPNLLVSNVPMYSVREVEQLALGGARFPLVLRAVRGSEVPRIFVVENLESMERKLPLWIEQLRKESGEVIFFAEKYLEGARHVVLPFVRMSSGLTRFFPTSDVSLQCRHRRIVEFCPAAGVDAGLLKELERHGAKFAEHFSFVGVGALEFLVDGSQVYLVDGYGRLGSTFRLWDMIAGTRAVAWQMAALESDGHGQMPKVNPTPATAAGIALRFHAEDSLLQLPQPGHVRELSTQRHWSFPGASARLSLSIEAGTEVLPSDTGFLGVLLAWGQEPKQALAVVQGTLAQTWISGSLQTNERFISELLMHPWVREGIFHAGFVDEEFLPEVRPAVELGLIMASACELIAPKQEGSVFRWSVGDLWVRPDRTALTWSEPIVRWKLKGLPGLSGVVKLNDGSRLRMSVFPVTENRWQVRLGFWTLPVRRILAGQKKKTDPKLLAMVPGRVHSILFREGAWVPAHETLVIVESLGMLVPHALPVEARVKTWHVSAEQIVHGGQDLASLELLPKS